VIPIAKSRTICDRSGGTVWRSQAVQITMHHALPTSSVERATRRDSESATGVRT